MEKEAKKLRTKNFAITISRMKKLLILICVALSSPFIAFSQNGNFTRLNSSEILDCTTYNAVAYNFVYNVIFRDYKAAKKLISPTAYNDFWGGDAGFVNIFESEKAHDIIDMRKIITLGYLPVITTSGDKLDLSVYFDENEPDPYKGMPAVNVRFDCVNAMGEFYDYANENYDSTVRVMMIYENGVWRVFSFK